MEERGITGQLSDRDLIDYLHSWGLREFDDEQAYFQWQRQSLSQQDLLELQSLVEQRQGGANERADIQFYDLLAKPTVLPILYSQRFNYFQKTCSLISSRLPSKGRVLDFGCGVGILTSYYARRHPELQFVGIDRSVRSIEMAQCEAKRRQLRNVCYRVFQDIGSHDKEVFDCILSTQALFQSEQEPGLPSKNWGTFERDIDPARQEALEIQTGLKKRLEALLALLAPAGKLICLEKTWNLGRRIFFQRALRGKDLGPLSEPVPCSYHELGEMNIDGPLFEVSRASANEPMIWHENPFHRDGETLYQCVGGRAEQMAMSLGTTENQEMFEGQHPHWGAWTFQFGVWEQVLAWSFCKTASGFRGLMLGSWQEKDLLFQLTQQVKNLNDGEFNDLLQDCWGSPRNMTRQEASPGYENHFASAQNIYERLPQKVILQEQTFADGQGKEMHLEVGTTQSLIYFYWANTFDQRQLVLMDEAGRHMLNEYYQESLQDAQRAS